MNKLFNCKSHIMSRKLEYYEASDEETEDIAVEQLEPGEFYDEEETEQEKSVIVDVAPKKPGTVILKPGILTLPAKKKKLVPIKDLQRVRELLNKYKALGVTQTSTPTSQKTIALKKVTPIKTNNVVNVEVLNDVSESTLEDTKSKALLQPSSLRDRFLHRKRVMNQGIEKVDCDERVPVKKFKYNPKGEVSINVSERRKIYWDTEKDIQKFDSLMLDTELLQAALKNQEVLDTKLNLIYKTLSSNTNNHLIPGKIQVRNDLIRTNTNPIEEVNFSQIPIRNSEEFLSLEEELKENPESVSNFELLLESLGSPENFSELIKRITGKLFTPNFMEQLGWSQVGPGGLQLKETAIKESIYNIFAKKYDGIQEDTLNEKFSQHFRSFRNHRNKNRSKQKFKMEQSESSS